MFGLLPTELVGALKTDLLSVVAQEVEHSLEDLLTLDHLELLELEQSVLPLALNKLFSLDVLLPQLDCDIALLTQGEFSTDWSRVLSNYGGRVAATDLASFQSLAGHRSALLTFAYGVRGPIAHVPALWLRVIGTDVRTQFRSLIAWDVLGAEMYVYPRWLGETLTAGFSQVI